MKELSIEEKARRYDEALGIAKGLYAKDAPDSLHLERMFPELKESEYEKIRKEMLQIVKESEDSFYMVMTPNKRERLIDWLEKQCKSSVCKVKIGETYKCVVSPRYTCFRSGDIYPVKDNFVAELINICSGCFVLLENHGEQIPANSAKNCKDEQKLIKEHNVCDFCEEKYGCVSPCSMKLVEEKKPADKVESKFEIEKGKWYVCTQTFTLKGKIVVIKGQTYQSNKDGAIEGENELLFVDKLDGKALNYFKPWTIQDAKDGDVLFTSSTASYEAFVFKGIDEKDNAKCYFAYDSEDGFREGIYHFIGRAINCKPATKEQCDLLFQKMKEAGYEWDAENKELKKVVDKEQVKKNLQDNGFRRMLEQKPAKWSIFDYRTWQYIVSDVLTKKDGIGQYLDSGECKKIAKYMQEEWSGKLGKEQTQEELRKGENYGIDGLYHAISILKKTLGKVDGYQSDDGILEHKCAINAVKELYEQKPAWSEENELHIRELESLVKRVWAIAEHENDKETIHKMSDLSFFLKTLKPQLKQKWSEDDEQYLLVCKNALAKYQTTDKWDACIISHWLENKLKSIKERTTWKPSEDEMKALAGALSLAKNCGEESAFDLRTLYEQLKKLREE